MLRAIKYISIALIFALMLVIGIGITLIRTIDPNQYKSDFSNILTEVIGQPVSIDGDLSWALYPRISLKAHGLHIKSHDKTKDPLLLKTIQVNLRILPLWHGNLEITTVKLLDMKFNYSIDKTGHSNWQSTKNRSMPQSSQHHDNKVSKHHYTIENITVQNATVVVDNKKSGQHYRLNKINYTGNLKVDADNRDVNILTDLSLDGKLSVGTMDINRIHIDSLTALFKGRGGIYKLSPINIKVYDGSSISNCQLDVRQQKIKLIMNEHFKNIQMHKLFADLGYQKRIHGILKGNIVLKSDDVLRLPASLNGTANIEVEEGHLQGVDILHTIEIANALFHRRSPPEKASKGATPFNSMSGDILITHGDIINENFKLISPSLQVTGAGHINLNHWNLEYQLNATAHGIGANTKIAKAQEFMGGGFPLIAKGSIDNYRLKPDMTKIIKQAAKYLIKHEIGDKVDELLKKGGDDIKKSLEKDNSINKFLKNLIE